MSESNSELLLEHPEHAATTIEEALWQRSAPDCLGYVAQAAAMLPRLEPRAKLAGYKTVAEYASDTNDDDLMRTCLASGYLDDAAKWQLFAYEQQNGNYAMDIPTIQELGENPVTLEATDEAQCDYSLLADIYASQLDILLGSPDAQNIDAHIDAVRSTLRKAIETGANEIVRNGVGDRVIHALLRAGKPEKAEAFASTLSTNDRRLYENSLDMYERYWEGEPLTPAYAYGLGSVFRVLAPAEYIQRCSSQIRADNVQAEDIKVFLDAGEFVRARQLYEETSKFSNNFNPERLPRMALLLAHHNQSKSAAEHVADVVGEMEGLRKSVALLKGDDNTRTDVVTSIENDGQLEQQFLRMCRRLGELPLSTQRLELESAFSALQKQALPRSVRPGRYYRQARSDTLQALFNTALGTGNPKTRATLRVLRDLSERPD